MGELADWALTALTLAAAAVVAAWTAGAVYFDLGGGSRWGRVLAWAWVVAVVAAFAFWHPLWQPALAFAAATALFLAWWLTLKPSHDRDWDASVAVLPRAERHGDAVTIENVRNNEYRSLTDFAPRYETRTYALSNLCGVDIIFFYWGSPWMSHPVLVFDFGPDGRVCLSIEVRFRKGQTYSVVNSLFRQQELIFVAADERDVILRRTKYGNCKEAYLYRLTTPADEARRIFLDYVGTINAIHAAPRWYHGVCANCTTNFYRLPNSRYRLDWRVLVNGMLDRALYDAGSIDRSAPFEAVRRGAYIGDIANAAPAAGFGDHVRAELERGRHDH